MFRHLFSRRPQGGVWPAPPRRRRLNGAISCVALIVGLAGCGGTPPPPPTPPAHPLAKPIDQALTRAIDFLIRQQDKDGAWRSDFYGPLKDGPSLTPLVLSSLYLAEFHVERTPSRESARQKGLDYLAAMARPDGTIDEGPHGLSQPAYTAALTVIALDSEQHNPRPARDAWLTYLRARQLTEANGWEPADKEYGGWGYCAILPRKPAPGEARPPLLESNLSATAFALGALKDAGAFSNDPAFKAALAFVNRCQNYADEADRRDAAFDDGGFYFIYDDPVRNKAGTAGKDRFGRERFASYGSATADGLSCLLACGVRKDDPRVVAARRWLETHFDASAHPGKYAANREASRNGVYYYYCRSVALTLGSGLNVREIDTPAGQVHWANALAEELIKRQCEDGSWVNDVMAQRENDPLIATSDAVQALSYCRFMLSP
jgi:squalene-hopene/tetraprenyl-beta-curcumene cyclase